MRLVWRCLVVAVGISAGDIRIRILRRLVLVFASSRDIEAYSHASEAKYAEADADTNPSLSACRKTGR